MILTVVNLVSIKNPNVSITLAYVRGNDRLIGPDNFDIGSRLLYGGPILNPLEPLRSKEIRSVNSSVAFNINRHVFSVIWNPEKIIFYVDGNEYATTYTSNYPELNDSEVKLFFKIIFEFLFL